AGDDRGSVCRGQGRVRLLIQWRMDRAAVGPPILVITSKQHGPSPKSASRERPDHLRRETSVRQSAAQTPNAVQNRREVRQKVDPTGRLSRLRQLPRTIAARKSAERQSIVAKQSLADGQRLCLTELRRQSVDLPLRSGQPQRQSTNLPLP